MVSLILFGLYALGVGLCVAVTGFGLWYMYDQKRDWVMMVNPNRGNAAWSKKRVTRDELEFKDAKGNKCSVPLQPARSFYKSGWRSGRVYVIDVAAGVQLYPSATDEEHLERPGWKLGALMGSRLDEMLIKMRGSKKALIENPIVIMVIIGLFVATLYGVYR